MESTSTLDGIFKPISNNSQSSSPNGICKPIPGIINQQCYFMYMRAQIFGHSSVQSSSTFRLQKADKPIYILRFKKIEQGQLLYPKTFPPIFQRQIDSRCASTQDYSRIDQMNPPPKQCSTIRVLVFSEEIGLLMPQVDFMVSHML